MVAIPLLEDPVSGDGRYLWRHPSLPKKRFHPVLSASGSETRGGIEGGDCFIGAEEET